MMLSQEAKTIPCRSEHPEQTPFPLELLALKRTFHFYTFLRDELELCRTDAEQEVVLSALLRTKMQIENLLRKLDLLLGSRGPDDPMRAVVA